MPKLPQFPAYATFADKLGWWLVRAVCVAVLAFLLAPILVVIPLSFSDSSFLAYPIPGWSLRWYRNLFSEPVWLQSLLTSVKILVPSAVLATTLGTGAAFGLARSNFRAKPLVSGLLLAPMIIPVIITAVMLRRSRVRVGAGQEASRLAGVV